MKPYQRRPGASETATPRCAHIPTPRPRAGPGLAHQTPAAPVQTYQRIEAHTALLVGAVYGMVYPLAALMAALVMLAYGVAWRLVPHEVQGEPPVPRWLRRALLVLFTGCAWFAYGPASMLQGDSLEHAKWVLVALTVYSVCYVA